MATTGRARAAGGMSAALRVRLAGRDRTRGELHDADAHYDERGGEDRDAEPFHRALPSVRWTPGH
jgi:hypothetical protein